MNNGVFKRLFDIAFSTIGLIIFMPVLIIIALLIKLEDGGPVFFKQSRIARYGKKFTIFKFRSMSVEEKKYGHGFEPGNKSRITKTGSFIRKTKIDELPQLVNILSGHMSFVGPRPEVEYWVNKFPEKWKLILQARPGLTDNASIEFRNEENILAESADPALEYEQNILPRKLVLYEEYINNNSLICDIKIIFLTIYTLIKSKN